MLCKSRPKCQTQCQTDFDEEICADEMTAYLWLLSLDMIFLYYIVSLATQAIRLCQASGKSSLQTVGNIDIQ